MAQKLIGSVAVVWRGDRAARDRPVPNDRLRPVFDALAAQGVGVEPAVYSEEWSDHVRDQLLQVDGVLVWVDPVAGGTDRSRLDAMLAELGSKGVWVSAHPDTIQKIGTKDVLYRTKDLGWGTDTHRYESHAELVARLPGRLAGGAPRVLKQNRGNGGLGVWKVELVSGPSTDRGGDVDGLDAIVRVQHAQPRDAVTEELTLRAFLDRCSEYFSGAGRVIDQAFAPRLPEGMIRAYLVREKVVGFAHQRPRTPSPEVDAPPPDQVLGLPSAKTMYGSGEPRFAALRSRLEDDWVPALKQLVGLDDDAVPMLWDADFLYGPKTASGSDTYVLCEINVSSVSPFPAEAVDELARAVAARLAGRAAPSRDRYRGD